MAFVADYVFFSASNPYSRKEQMEYVRQVLESEPYVSAFAKVKLKDLEWKLKIMVIIGRLHWAMGVYILHMAENGGRR